MEIKQDIVASNLKRHEETGHYGNYLNLDTTNWFMKLTQAGLLKFLIKFFFLMILGSSFVQKKPQTIPSTNGRYGCRFLLQPYSRHTRQLLGDEGELIKQAESGVTDPAWWE